uniref:Uncharacterized protein n=1 Tax=Rhipicephalus zambeziensis TaxID=60191 RepID=A0A224YGP9_9ACAR
MVPAEKDSRRRRRKRKMSRRGSIEETKKKKKDKDAAILHACEKKINKTVRMFEWITVCAHAYSPSLRRVHARVRALSFRRRSSGHTVDTGWTQAVRRRFVVAVFHFCRGGVPLPAVHSQSVRVGREGTGEWGRTIRVRGNGECSGSFVIIFFHFKRRRRDIAL